MAGGPRIASKWLPTGKKRYRISLLGRVVLQVEETRRTGIAAGRGDADYTHHQTRFRDAAASDLIDEEV